MRFFGTSISAIGSRWKECIGEPFFAVMPLSVASSDARSGDTVWKVESRVLELYGILPSDLIEFDTNAKPRRGDVVLAEQIGPDLDRERKLIRVFNPPFLVSKTMDASLDELPIPIDLKDERVKIIGAFVRLTRSRRT